jgi:hypothetical protein
VAGFQLPMPDALGTGKDPERGAIGIRQPVDGQAPRHVIDRRADPRDLRVVGTPVGPEVLAEPGADQLGERHAMPQAHGQRDGVGIGQARAAGTVLAPVDEHLTETAVVTLVGDEMEAFRADGHGRGVADATPRHLPLNTRHHNRSPAN